MPETAAAVQDPPAPAADKPADSPAAVIPAAPVAAAPAADATPAPASDAPPPAAAAPAAPVVPETYALTLPAGSPLSTPELDALTTHAKAMGLTQTQAQQFAQIRSDELAAAIADVAKEGEEIRNDPVIGGANFERTQQQIGTGLRWMFGEDEPAARQLFDKLALGNSKVLVKGLLRIANAIKEDGHVSGRASGVPRKSLEERLVGD